MTDGGVCFLPFLVAGVGSTVPDTSLTSAGNLRPRQEGAAVSLIRCSRVVAVGVVSKGGHNELVGLLLDGKAIMVVHGREGQFVLAAYGLGPTNGYGCVALEVPMAVQYHVHSLLTFAQIC